MLRTRSLRRARELQRMDATQLIWLAATFGLHSAFARLKTRDLLDVDLRQVWCVAAVRPNRSVAVQMTPAFSMQQGSLLLLGSLRIWGVQVRRTTLC